MAQYTAEIVLAEFDEHGLATVSGWVTIYQCHPVTREFIGASMDNVPYAGSVVQDSYYDKPVLPEKAGIAVIRSPDEKSWLQVPDHRGKEACHAGTRQKVIIEYVGELKPEHTLSLPKTPFDLWDGEQWVTDITAQQQYEQELAENQRQLLRDDAEQQIALLARKERLDMASEQDIALLREWEIYSVKLADIDISAGSDIHWPEKPE
ncbi:tail fiber assembly protein [Xenorhabdus bovienii]|uniref:tail fiber assembly protein n=1 Tax=Xenorhabdus bovienii TaxID=40576 RepID=UPI00237C8204|nr:tail fiber assembly protein [Xenorhabdus bovienii]MDE1481016.1 tail fiber assembly protein [Xenorhabdus bovienii]